MVLQKKNARLRVIKKGKGSHDNDYFDKFDNEYLNKF
jgi:hypothetical protein